MLSISRQLDMGGMPSAMNASPARPIDASKNCKLRVVAFDFDMLTKAVGEQGDTKQDQEGSGADTKTSPALTASSEVFDKTSPGPNVGMVEEMAKLLNVNLGGEPDRRQTDRQEEEDFSRLAEALSGSTSASGTSGETTRDESAKSKDTESSSHTDPARAFQSDVRDKYAAKLRKKLDGGMAGVNLAKQEAESSLKRGDASGHLAARAAAVSQGSSSTAQKWMALSGTGSLLSYISHRGMKLVLLPTPNNPIADEEGQRMEDFTKQLPKVRFDFLLQKGENTNSILAEMTDEVQLDPVLTMVVSDRDDYLRQAKEKGMITCRVRFRPNAPRGNVSAHYNVEAIADVQEVVDDVNGISFNAVFAAGK